MIWKKMDVKKDIKFNQYYKYEDLINNVKRLIESYPNLSLLHKIGKSYQGRDMYVVELTNKNTGPALEKPAFWMDGNIHGREITPSIANLKFIWHVLTKYSKGYLTYVP